MNTQGTAAPWAAVYDNAATTGNGRRPPVGRNGLAVPAMVLGITGLSTSIVFIGGLLGAVGLPLGIAALIGARRGGTGLGKAIIAVVTSFLAIVLAVLLAIGLVWYADRTQKCYQPDSLRQYQQCVRQQLSGA
ncbi:DUF4190 domain-containing protein [Kitasatospora sp. McL0602]|uniref:DUF4190 domain-containing protein n=1 Tax=Kitasatospora sp. McL0602 TaxID=3439530 RepID=UPI003F8BA00D